MSRWCPARASICRWSCDLEADLRGLESTGPEPFAQGLCHSVRSTPRFFERAFEHPRLAILRAGRRRLITRDAGQLPAFQSQLRHEPASHPAIPFADPRRPPHNGQTSHSDFCRRPGDRSSVCSIPSVGPPSGLLCQWLFRFEWRRSSNGCVAQPLTAEQL